jgi:hypothetical protein
MQQWFSPSNCQQSVFSDLFWYISQTFIIFLIVYFYIVFILQYQKINYNSQILLCVFKLLVPLFVVHYDFRIKTVFGSTLPPVVCRRAHVLFRMFGSTLPPVVCRRAVEPNILNKTWALLQTTGGKVEPNILNKTWALLQTTGGKVEPNTLNKTWALLQTTGGKVEPNILNKTWAGSYLI